jgi:hypothetical protein
MCGKLTDFYEFYDVTPLEVSSYSALRRGFGKVPFNVVSLDFG